MVRFFKRIVVCSMALMLFTAEAASCAQQRQYLADRHKERSISCEACHVALGKPEIKKDALGRQACVTCHGYYPEVIKRTEKKNREVNPHDQHDGDLPCTECHKGHKQGVNYCEECHGTYIFKVP